MTLIGRPGTLTSRVGRARKEATRLRGQAQRSAMGELSAWAEAVVGSGRAKDHPPSDEAARAHRRRQAVSRLGADLAAWSRCLEGEPKAGVEVRRTLGRWKVDPDLASLREEADLVRLPDDARPGCRALWSGVDAMLGRVGSGRTPRAATARRPFILDQSRPEKGLLHRA